MIGFEPTTTRSQSECSTKLSHLLCRFLSPLLLNLGTPQLNVPTEVIILLLCPVKWFPVLPTILMNKMYLGTNTSAKHIGPSVQGLFKVHAAKCATLWIILLMSSYWARLTHTKNVKQNKSKYKHKWSCWIIPIGYSFGFMVWSPEPGI